MREEILKKITDNPNPLTVNLSGMQIKDNEILEIVQIIKHLRPNLVKIDLDNNNIGDKGAIILSQFIRSLDGMKEISLQYNNIGKNGALGLFSLKKDFPELDILFHGNKIIDVGEMDEIEHLATAPGFRI